MNRQALSPRSVVLDEADLALLRWLGRSHQLSDRIEDAGDGLVLGGELALQAGFQLVQTLGELLAGRQGQVLICESSRAYGRLTTEPSSASA